MISGLVNFLKMDSNLVLNGNVEEVLIHRFDGDNWYDVILMMNSKGTELSVQMQFSCCFGNLDWNMIDTSNTDDSGRAYNGPGSAGILTWLMAHRTRLLVGVMAQASARYAGTMARVMARARGAFFGQKAGSLAHWRETC